MKRAPHGFEKSARRSHDDRAPSRSGRAMSAPNRASGALLAIASGSIATPAFDAHNREGKFRADTLHRPGTFSSPVRFLPMMDTFTMLSFVVTFLAGATAGAWLNSLTNGSAASAPNHVSRR